MTSISASLRRLARPLTLLAAGVLAIAMSVGPASAATAYFFGSGSGPTEQSAIWSAEQSATASAFAAGYYQCIDVYPNATFNGNVWFANVEMMCQSRPVPPPPPTGPTGPIVSAYSSKCVDVAGAKTTNGTAVQIYSCNGTNAQKWTVASDGTLRALGKCLDVTNSGTANGTYVQLWDCNGTGAQKWTVQPWGVLQNTNSGRCLDELGFQSADGSRLGIWDCNGLNNQQWTIPS